MKHGGRAHSKFSASGAERWFNCTGSVELSEGMPDKTSKYAEEGTKAHEILEATLRCELSGNDGAAVEEYREVSKGAPWEMIRITSAAARFIVDRWKKAPHPTDFYVEDRTYLKFIHPEMFGTFDAAIAEHFESLHVFDYKYGAGHPVSVRENLQMIFYGIGLAHRFDWNFKRVRLWIIQPRISGYQGPTFWELPVIRLKGWVRDFEKAVHRVEKAPPQFKEGPWCYFCKAKPKCPLKQEKRLDSARSIFTIGSVK